MVLPSTLFAADACGTTRRWATSTGSTSAPSVDPPRKWSFCAAGRGASALADRYCELLLIGVAINLTSVLWLHDADPAVARHRRGRSRSAPPCASPAGWSCSWRRSRTKSGICRLTSRTGGTSPRSRRRTCAAISRAATRPISPGARTGHSVSGRETPRARCSTRRSCGPRFRPCFSGGSRRKPESRRSRGRSSPTDMSGRLGRPPARRDRGARESGRWSRSSPGARTSGDGDSNLAGVGSSTCGFRRRARRHRPPMTAPAGPRSHRTAHPVVGQKTVLTAGARSDSYIRAAGKAGPTVVT